MPDPAKQYALKSAAPGYAVGAVLEQEGRSLRFLRKKMSPAELRQATYDQELLALIRTLQKWRRFFWTADVTAFTDHRVLQYVLKFKTDKLIRGLLGRCSIFFSYFQYLKIVYKAVAANVAVTQFLAVQCTKEQWGKLRIRSKWRSHFAKLD